MRDPESRPRRVGVLGGSFNPIHHAHLFTAEEAAASFQLDTVLVLPAAQSPLKERASASVEDRVEMVRLAVAGNPLLEVSMVDVDRPPPSYTVETMRILTSQDPQSGYFLILGIDALEDLLEWRDPEGLLDMCQIVVVSRPGHALAIPAEVHERLGQRAQRILLQPMPLLEISSTEIRRRLKAGEPVRYLLPDGVERYIRERGLYGAHLASGQEA